MRPPVLERWLAAVLGTPGLTAIRDPAVARAVLLEDALRAVELVDGTEGASWTSARAAARPGSRSPSRSPAGK